MADARARFQHGLLFAAALTAVVICVPARTIAAGTTTTSAGKREAAQAQFARAEEQRSALNSRAAADHTLAEYKQVVSAYRRVALITPRSSDVPDSFIAIAELYTEMGDRFGRNYYQSAVDSYQFLIHEYPANRDCPEAMLRVARLQRDRLGDAALAAKTYEEFLRVYRRSPRKREAQEALAELSLLLHSESPASPDSNRAGGSTEQIRAASAESSSEIPRVQRISTAATHNSARITIELEDKVDYTSARISNPDRIFFDLHAARLTREIASGNIHVDGNLVKAVRVAQNQAGVVRIVFDVAGVKDYTASLLGNPTRLLIDFYASEKALHAAQQTDSNNDGDPEDRSAPAQTVGKKAVVQPVAKKTGGDAGEASVAPAVRRSEAAPVSRGSLVRSGNSGGTRPKPGAPASQQPTRDGQATLTRALGLKIGRIVIDAGHGGHDTGTIGPTGLMEKDLCLDVALRLGNIIERKLPSAEVVFTRSDDTFIPLEERTSIANSAKADLFLSIHGNSSRDHAARGVETYYLNLRGSPEAMEVAARENSNGGQSVHDLQDLVQKIARNEKIGESREFAEDLQDSLTKRILGASRNVKDRGVRKAPFVVLIGADMPSVLAEISFLSNPADEKLLKKPEYRQKIADGLYQGVVNYLQSLNSVTQNLPPRLPSAGPSHAVPGPTVASIEQSRNRQ